MAENTRPGSSVSKTKLSTVQMTGITKQRSRLNDDDGWNGIDGYLNAKKTKLDEQFNRGSGTKDSNIFAGVAVYVNGYTNPSSDELKRILRRNGGSNEMYLSKTRVTHIVASNLPNSKYHLTKTLPVVRPEWITDSVAAKKRLSHLPYLIISNKSKLQLGLKILPVTPADIHSSALRLPKKVTEIVYGGSDIHNVEFPHEGSKFDGICNVKLSGIDSYAVSSSAGFDCTSDKNLKTCKPVVNKHQPDGNVAHSYNKLVDASNIVKDDGDIDIVYNSDEESNGGIKSTNTTLFQNDVSPNKRRSRIYSIRKLQKSNSRSIDATVLVDGANKCNGSIDCQKMALLNCADGLNQEVECLLHPGNRKDVGQISAAPSNHSAVSELPLDTAHKSFQMPSDEMRSQLPGFKPDNTLVDLSLLTQISSGVFPGLSAPLVSEYVLTVTSQSETVTSSNNHQSTSSSSDGLHSHIELLPSISSSFCMSRHPVAGTIPLSENPEFDILKPFSTSTACVAHRPVAGTIPLPEKSQHAIPKPFSASTLSPSLSLAFPPVTGTSPLSEKSELDIPKQNYALTSSSLCAMRPPFAKTIALSEKSEHDISKPFSASTASLVYVPEPSLKQISPKRPPTMAKTSNTNFLSEFYSNSRLHHIATWGAELKAYVSEIQRSNDNSYPGREKLRQKHVENALKLGQSETLSSARLGASEKTVMHIDMDCFFVSVGLLARPDLKGKPVAVTHSRGQGVKPNPDSNQAWESAEWMKKRDGKLKSNNTSNAGNLDSDEEVESCESARQSNILHVGSTGVQKFHSMAEIASCSYEARKAGVKNGMFMGTAVKLCPDLQTIPYNFSEYNRVSRILYDAVASYTHDIEAVSCDEMLIDCTDVLSNTGATAAEFAQVLRAEMLEKSGCPASAGIGPNILLARLATKRAKPNGQFAVIAAEAKNFIKDQLVSDLPGVGYSLSRKLALLAVHTCGELQNVPLTTLRQEFGPKIGEKLHGFCLGQDNREIKGDKQRSSVSAEVNYGIRFTKEPEAVTFLQDLSLEVKRRLDAIKVKGRSITLKLMVRRPDAPVETAKFMGHGICNTFNKSSNLPLATNDEKVIAREVVSLYRAHRVMASDVRGIGIQINKIERIDTDKRTSSGALGHQSMLNFAIPKTTSSTTIPESVAMATPSTSEADNEYVKTAKTLTKPVRSLMNSRGDVGDHSGVSFTSFNSGRRSPVAIIHSESSVVGGMKSHVSSATGASFTQKLDSGNEKLSQRQQIFPEAGSSCDKTKINSDHHCDGLVHYDENFCHVPAIQKTAIMLNRACDPNMLGPSCSFDFPRTSRTPEKRDGAYAGFLSESQIDSEVLQELPSEIAHEILEDIWLRKQQNQSYAALSSVSHGSSTYTGGYDRYAKDMALNAGLPSISQLDLTCFSALPLHLQQELKAEYAKQEVTVQISADKMAALAEGNAFTRLKSPLKDRRGKQSRAGQKPPKQSSTKGRSRGKKMLTFGSSKVKAESSYNAHTKAGSARMLSACSDVIICDDDDSCNSRNRYAVDGSVDVQSVPHMTTHPSSTSKSPAGPLQFGNTYRKCQADDKQRGESSDELKFCGVCSLKDVRNILKEWLALSEGPQDDDVDVVMEYLIKLVEHRNLEQVFCLLKFLTRRAITQSNPQWTECVSSVTQRVQHVVSAFYGATFKL